ncbi:hypothetical protein H3H36_17110 [Duganella sp. FT3S]|uniref:Lysozyme inhibitor n=1 Tax=Rugamonas fusca TaxID=2758568 RepID=A0A7W2EJM0_9BURK|nr:hypothetical protein [Rugamonas fusca]MBA5607079.1 hypothetical protein [Rugamonas fusca]
MSISKLFLACSLALASLTLATSAQAEVKKPAKHKVHTAATAAAPTSGDPDADEPSVTGATVVDFDCELGNKITLYKNDADDSHIALRWKKRLMRLTRVGTTTGAQRFENKLLGLVWIGIPAKSMLLDSKGGHQLANECRNAEQNKAVSLAAPAADAKL